MEVTRIGSRRGRYSKHAETSIQAIRRTPHAQDVAYIPHECSDPLSSSCHLACGQHRRFFRHIMAGRALPCAGNWLDLWSYVHHRSFLEINSWEASGQIFPKKGHRSEYGLVFELFLPFWTHPGWARISIVLSVLDCWHLAGVGDGGRSCDQFIHR